MVDINLNESEMVQVTALITLAVLAAVIFLWAMSVYNGLVRMRNMKDEAWSGIDVQLKRRVDLLPNLVQTVKGYASHEQATLLKVTEARSMINNAGDDPAKRMEAENFLTGALRSLFAVAESYPDLKASQNFMHLQEQLSGLEDEIQMSRRYYNGTARDLNIAIQRFPAVLIARQFGFSEAPFFEVEDAAKVVPTVSFVDTPAAQAASPAPEQPPRQAGFESPQQPDPGAPRDEKNKIGF